MSDSSSSRPRVRPRGPRGRTTFSLPNGFRAAVFDVDGLLVDTEPLWGQAEASLLERHGLGLTSDDRLDSVGRSIDASVRLYVERLGYPADAFGRLRAELLDLVRARFAAAARPRPGGLELLAALRGRLPLGIASSSDRDLVELSLTTAGFDLEWFDAIVTGDEVAQPKPAPDLYLRACERLGEAPTTVVAFEDSRPGIAAALEAGSFCVAVPQHPSVGAGADLVVDSLLDLLPFVDPPSTDPRM